MSRYLRYQDLKPLKGIPFSRQHIGRLQKAGKFPLSVSFGDNTEVFIEEEIDRWTADRIADRDAKAAALAAPSTERIRASSGSDTAGLVPMIQRKPDRPLLRVAEDLHRVRRRRVVRDVDLLDVPHPGQVGDVRRRCPSCGSRAGRRRHRTRGCSPPSAGRSSAGRRSRAGRACRAGCGCCSPGRRPPWPGATGRSPAAPWTAAARRCR